MAKRIDPDQTAPEDLYSLHDILSATMVYKILGHLPCIKLLFSTLFQTKYMYLKANNTVWYVWIAKNCVSGSLSSYVFAIHKYEKSRE